MQNKEMTISEIKAMYFGDAALMLSPYPLYRYQYKGDRFYYYVNPADAAKLDEQDRLPVHFAVGITTLTRKTLPQPEGLTRWIANLGYDEAIAYRDERAKYGSLMHTCIATLLIKRAFDLDQLATAVHAYCKLNAITVNEDKWTDDLKQDVLAFAQFVRDYNVRPLAIELSLVSPTLGVAGTLDLLCEMDDTTKGYFGEVYKSGENKGQPKETKRTTRVLALVDFKSGRVSNGSLHNAAQLALQRLLLQGAFPEWPRAKEVAKLYNWHPKDWRKSPTYILVDQTGSFSAAACMNIISLYRELETEPEERTMLEMYGVIELDAPEPRQNYAATVIKDVVQRAVNENEYKPAEYDYFDTYLNDDQP
jgi:hypothetical protein